MSGGKQNQITWIAVDWGTTHLRAWAMSGDGKIVAQLSSKDGMAGLKPAEFEPALLVLVGDWLRKDCTMPIVACGMVGARQGWVEAPYQSAPCKPLLSNSLIKAKCSDPRIDVHVVPGVKQMQPADVMRGEETQIAGFLSKTPDFNGVICLPGTHSKWVKIQQGTIETFSTFMTGELFALISGKSVLRHSIENEAWDALAFLSGVKTMMDNPESFASELFSIRAQALLAGQDSGEARAKLSGYLIGMELSGTRNYWLKQNVILIGAHELSSHYAKALTDLGSQCKIYDTQTMTLAGLAVARNQAASG